MLFGPGRFSILFTAKGTSLSYTAAVFVLLAVNRLSSLLFGTGRFSILFKAMDEDKDRDDDDDADDDAGAQEAGKETTEGVPAVVGGGAGSVVSIVSGSSRSTTVSQYKANQIQSGLLNGEDIARSAFIKCGRGRLFRFKKFLVDEDMNLGSKTEAMARDVYMGGKGGDITSEQFSPTWERHKKRLRESVNNRRSNVANSMKVIFLRKYTRCLPAVISYHAHYYVCFTFPPFFQEYITSVKIFQPCLISRTCARIRITPTVGSSVSTCWCRW